MSVYTALLHTSDDGMSVKAVIYICSFKKNWELKLLFGAAIITGKHLGKKLETFWTQYMTFKKHVQLG